jgi:hypothetical protein
VTSTASAVIAVTDLIELLDQRVEPAVNEHPCTGGFAGSKPADKINPMAVQVLAEHGITLTEA